MSVTRATENDIAIVPRGIVSQPTAQPSNTLKANRERRMAIKKYLQAAIDDGDPAVGEGNVQAPIDNTPVMRRALIIAPTYEEYDNNDVPGLPATANDAKLIHSMLVEYFGYERKNIRVLCDAWDSEDKHYSRPTRENILNGLIWLTSNVPDGAYRYLHFSGHGIIKKSTNKKEGKLIRRPGKNMWNQESWSSDVKPREGDTEKAHSQVDAGRITEITLPLGDLDYYNEAMATGNLVGDKTLENNLIYDKELNEHLSRLPENCVMNCTLDCCSSGRILNLSTKVDGAGFRAGGGGNGVKDENTKAGWSDESKKLWHSETVLANARAPSKAPDPVGAATDSEQNASSPVLETTELEDKYFYGARILSRMLGYFGIGIFQVTLSEELPEQERKMDHTKPGVVRSWSAAHERQEAANSGDGYSGTFTKAFTDKCQAYKNSKASFTYDQLFKAVSTEVTAQRKNAVRDDVVPQFVQLWSNLSGGEPFTKGDLLGSGFDL